MRGRLVFDDHCEIAETLQELLLGDMNVRSLAGVVDAPDAGDIEARARQAAITFPDFIREVADGPKSWCSIGCRNRFGT